MLWSNTLLPIDKAKQRYIPDTLLLKPKPHLLLIPRNPHVDHYLYSKVIVDCILKW